jgi:hypothetical protein
MGQPLCTLQEMAFGVSAEAVGVETEKCKVLGGWLGIDVRKSERSTKFTGRVGTCIYGNCWANTLYHAGVKYEDLPKSLKRALKEGSGLLDEKYQPLLPLIKCVIFDSSFHTLARLIDSVSIVMVTPDLNSSFMEDFKTYSRFTVYYPEHISYAEKINDTQFRFYNNDARGESSRINHISDGLPTMYTNDSYEKPIHAERYCVF